MSTRREFVKTISTATAIIGCGVGLSSILQSCVSVHYVQGEIDQNQVRIKKSEFVDRKFIVILNETMPAPLYVSSGDEETDFVASLMICTHLGCELKATGTFLTCPCHGSEFSGRGEVLNGPADLALTSYSIIETEEEIIIELTKLIKA